MMLSSTWRSALALLLLVTPFAAAFNMIESSSLNSCSQNKNETGFSASLFSVRFFPDNDTLDFDITGQSTISGKVILQLDVTAYGYSVYSGTIDPCTSQALVGACPMVPGQIPLSSTIQNVVPRSDLSQIPSIAYTIPDLDGEVTVRILNRDDPTQELTCVQAELSNGKTVYQKGVGWATAVVAGLALLTSAMVSGLGHSNTAVHVAANALSLFGFFQGQAIFGMTAIHLPPIVASWTQNFQWAMGIIHVDFIQSIATWYQRSTGGTPSQIISRLQITSVDVQRVKRGLEAVAHPIMTAGRALVARSGGTNPDQTLQVVTIRGIERVGFVAGIEPTNIFMTGYIFLIVFFLLVILGVAAFKWILETFAKSGKVSGDKFTDFRNGWVTVLKGIMFRLILIGFPQMVVLCFWEVYVRDSAGEIALAMVTILTMLAMLGYVCFRVTRIARRSIMIHKNPAYILYSDPVCLHKWGFLYVQFKAASYWFIMPMLGYMLIIGLLVAFGQNAWTAQGVGFFVVNGAYLVTLCIMRPYMDKKTNAFNISIAVINFADSILLLFFTGILGVPPLAIGVMGLVFFVLNAVFAFVLIILVLIATGYAIFSKNPDVRYQPMRDDRASFIKSNTNLNTELDALGATARGETKAPYKLQEFEDDGENWHQPPRSPYAGSGAASPYGNPYGGTSLPYGNKDAAVSYDGGAYSKTMSVYSQQSQRSGTASPWQRGAGYDR